MFPYSSRAKTKLIFISIFFIIFVLLFILFYLIEINLGPTLLAIAEARARIIATEAINEAVSRKITGKIQYKDLINIHKNKDGEIVLIQVNTVEINRIESNTALYVIDVLKKNNIQEIEIPIGQITKSNILANFGPTISASILPVGAVEVNVVEAFEEAGINQTRHKIFIDVKTWMKIAVPLVSSSIEVSTQIPVTETIIIGNVPSTIINLNN
ncbi:MAG TPA: sporulation protein YunB [Thermoanaerobacterales bacterium]|nr:sporulation protein YunB [Thermoanaerobacterales bacterium]